MTKRVLILSASVGSGHKSAAGAIEAIFRQQPGVEVRNEDALKRTSRLYQVTSADFYFTMVKESPWLVGWWYDQNDEPFRNENLSIQLWNQLNAQPLVRFIRDYDPDITVCTHFMPAGMVAQLLSEGKLNTTLSIVTTDYDFQGMWLSRIFNRYFVAIDETKAHLTELGVDPQRIIVSGIPVNPIFGMPVDRAVVLERYGLRADLPILLVSAGALGGGPAREIVSQILRMRTPVQTIVVCGRNQLLRHAVTARVMGNEERFRILGFTNDMPDLMRVADLFIGKPGGLTSAECMAAGLPMAVIEPIPGQEERNADHLLEEGVAIRCRSLMVLAHKIDRIFEEPGRLDQMRANTRRLACPGAARMVVDTLLQDESSPHHFSWAERRQIIAAASGEPEASADPALADSGVALYHDDTGIYIGTISPIQLQFLLSLLEEESETDDNYYIDTATIDWLADKGADADLLATLSKALEGREGTELRWVNLAAAEA